MSELSLYELEMERAELLPARETLQVLLSPVTNITTNTAIAVSAGNFNLADEGDAGSVLASASSLQANDISS